MSASILYEEYHPYGTSAYRASNGSVDVSARRYRYTGKERDEETGLYYNGARYLAAWLGRWTSADPIGMQAGVNLYEYCRGSPINYVDPSGNKPTLLFRGPIRTSLWDTPGGQVLTGLAKGARWLSESRHEAQARADAQTTEYLGTTGLGGGIAAALSFMGEITGRSADPIGGFYDLVKGTHTLAHSSEPLQDARSGSLFGELDRAKEGIEEGNTFKATKAVLGFLFGTGMMAVGAGELKISTTTLTPPGPSLQPAFAGGGAAVADGVLALPVIGGATDVALGGLLSMMSKGGEEPEDRGEVWDAEGGVDFANSKDLYPAGPGQKSIVKIKLNGDYGADYVDANRAAGLGERKYPPKGYTWHHLNDYDPTTGMGTMQLVKTEAHGANTPHLGGVAQWERYTGKKYTGPWGARQ